MMGCPWSRPHHCVVMCNICRATLLKSLSFSGFAPIWEAPHVKEQHGLQELRANPSQRPAKHLSHQSRNCKGQNSASRLCHFRSTSSPSRGDTPSQPAAWPGLPEHSRGCVWPSYALQDCGVCSDRVGSSMQLRRTALRWKAPLRSAPHHCFPAGAPGFLLASGTAERIKVENTTVEQYVAPVALSSSFQPSLIWDQE